MGCHQSKPKGSGHPSTPESTATNSQRDSDNAPNPSPPPKPSNEISISGEIWQRSQQSLDLHTHSEDILNKISSISSEKQSNSSINGLVNHGNTCFINASIQCLARMQPLVDYFLSDLQREDKLKDLKDTDREFVQQFANLLTTYHLNSEKILRIRKFCRLVEQILPGYKVGQQEDAQEFIKFFLDNLHRCLNRVKHTAADVQRFNAIKHRSFAKKQSPKAGELRNRAIEVWRDYLTIDNSVIVGAFTRHFPRPNPANHKVPELRRPLVQLRVLDVLLPIFRPVADRLAHPARIPTPRVF